jgi:hypothetical protein
MVAGCGIGFAARFLMQNGRICMTFLISICRTLLARGG